MADEEFQETPKEETKPRLKRVVRRSPKEMQDASIEPPPASEESRIRVTLRTQVGYEYHQQYAESVVRDLINPEVADAFIEVQISNPKIREAVKHRFLHTSNIVEVDIHDEMRLDL